MRCQEITNQRNEKELSTKRFELATRLNGKRPYFEAAIHGTIGAKNRKRNDVPATTTKLQRNKEPITMNKKKLILICAQSVILHMLSLSYDIKIVTLNLYIPFCVEVTYHLLFPAIYRQSPIFSPITKS